MMIRETPPRRQTTGYEPSRTPSRSANQSASAGPVARRVGPERPHARRTGPRGPRASRRAGPGPTRLHPAEFAAKVRQMTRADGYTSRQAAYDLRKLRGKHLILKPGRTRRNQVPPSAARTITALLALRDRVIAPVLAGIRSSGQDTGQPTGPKLTAATRTSGSACRHSSAISASPRPQPPHRQHLVDAMRSVRFCGCRCFCGLGRRRTRGVSEMRASGNWRVPVASRSGWFPGWRQYRGEVRSGSCCPALRRR
jgi:hypothetical protein